MSNGVVWSSSYSPEKGEFIIEAIAAIAFTKQGEHVLTLSTDRRFGPTAEPYIRVWDPLSAQCLGTIVGESELSAIAAGQPWRATVRGQQVIIEQTGTNAAVAWLPCPLSYPGHRLTTAPCGRIHVVVVGKQFLQFAFVGGE